MGQITVKQAIIQGYRPFNPCGPYPLKIGHCLKYFHDSDPADVVMVLLMSLDDIYQHNRHVLNLSLPKKRKQWTNQT